ncbi:MAG: hypothetical protein RI883_2496 [Bacteroidota bacterium]
MKQEELITGFTQLGSLMVSLGNEEKWNGFISGVTEEEYENLISLVKKQFYFNGWFTNANVNGALIALGNQLTEEQLSIWLRNYSYSVQPKNVAIIMAGNIPLVGFHDFLCVLMSGNTAICKLSSDDKTLLPALGTVLIQFLPELKDRIIFTTGRIQQMDAVIATGSNNTLLYFEQYFGKYPHIFRKNKTSLAVISGNETIEDFDALGHDIFDYFGLGCRNVSHLLFPKDFELNRFFEGIINHSDVANHNKYANNYDYNKAIYLMNNIPMLDNNFVLLMESKELFSPLSIIHYQYYSNQDELEAYLELQKENLQAIVGVNYILFGQAQCPNLDDYADGVDTMAFLNNI